MVWFFVLWAVVLLFGLVVLRGAPYVPSRTKYVDNAFTDLYKIGKNDTLVDIGSGDGVVLRRASVRGAKAVGYEINIVLFVLSKILCMGSKRVTVYFGDALLQKFPDETTVVYVFTASPFLKKIERKIQTEANRVGRPLSLILYGNSLTDHKPEKKMDAYNLYTFSPLQTDEA